MAALYCAHRASLQMLPPSSLVLSLGMGADRSSTARVPWKAKAKVEVEELAKLKPQEETEKTPGRIDRCST